MTPSALVLDVIAISIVVVPLGVCLWFSFRAGKTFDID